MRRPTVILLILAAAVALGAAADSRPVAMVTDLVGRASDGAGAALGIQDLLRPGQRIRLPEGAWARVVYLQGSAGGRLERLTGPCLVEVTAAGGKALEGKVQVERAPVRTTLVPGRNVDRMAGYSVRGTIVLTMRPDLREGETPRFSWATALPGPFSVSVVHEGEVVWREETSERQASYRGPALRPDTTYLWKVEGKAEGSEEAFSGEPVGRGAFRIVSAAARERLAEAAAQAREMAQGDLDDPTPHVLALALHLDSLLLEEAIPLTREALRLRPGDLELHRTLRDLLYVVGGYEADSARKSALLEEARVEKERVAELEKAP